MMTGSDVIFRGLKLVSRKWDDVRRYAGKYTFTDRSRGCEKMLMIIAGYQDYVWDTVLDRIGRLTPADIDVCVGIAGKDVEELRTVCRNRHWSYLSTKENKIALVMNLCVRLHPRAEWIYKLDEDIFIGKHYFGGLMDVYRAAEKSGRYRVGLVGPCLNVNGVGYRYFLSRVGKLDEYESLFGPARCTCDVDPVYRDGRAAVYLWENTLPLDVRIEEFYENAPGFFAAPVRFSVGAFLMKRGLWERMGGYKVAADGQLAWEEIRICEYCMTHSYAILIAENVLAGHFGFGGQKQTVRPLYEERKEEFVYRDTQGWPG